MDFGKLGMLTDASTGKKQALWALIVTLPASRYQFVWPMYRQTLEETIAGLEAVWRFFERHGRPRLSCPVRVELFFGGVQANHDIDNLAKSCLDALNGIAFEDDRQVVELVARKASRRSPQTVITITEVRP
jgi:hypothetical protein